MRNTEIIAQLRLNNRQFEQAVKQSDSSFQQFAKGLATTPGAETFATMTTKVRGMGVALGSLPAGIAVVAAALGALTLKAEQMGAQFEHAINKMRTLGPDVEATLGTLRSGVLQAFTDLPITESLDSVSDAMYEILSSGIDASKGVETLRVAAEAAVGGFTTTKVAVDGLTSAMNAYRDFNLDARTATDQMLVAVQLGKIRFDELASSIGLVTPVASSLGVPFRDILAIAAQLSLQGVKVEAAMTGIRQALVNIQRPTAQFREQFPELAKQFTASRLAGDGLIKFLRDFQTAAQGNSKAVGTLFSDLDGLKTVQGLLKDETRGAQAALDAISNSAGATADAVAKVSTSTVSAYQLLRNQFVGALTEVGSALDRKVNPAMLAFARLIARVRDDAGAGSREIRRFISDAAAARGPVRDPRTAETLRNTADEVFRLYGQRGAAIFDDPSLTVGTLRQFRGALAGNPQGFAGITPAMIAQMTRDLDARIAIAERAEAAARAEQQQAEDKARAAAAKTQEANARAEAEREAAEQAAKQAEEATRTRAQRVAQAKQLAQEIELATTRALQGVAAAMEMELERFIERAAEAVRLGTLTAEQLRVAVGVRREAITAVRVQDRVDGALAASERSGGGLTEQLALIALQAELRGQRDLLVSLEARKEVEAQIARLRERTSELVKRDAQAIDKQTKKLLEAIRANIKQNLPDDDDEARLRRQVQAWGELTAGIANAGDALGLLGISATSTLRGVGGLVSQLSQLTAKNEEGKSAFSLLSTFGKIGAAASIVGNVAQLAAGLFGESPEEKQARQELRANTEALRAMTQRLGSLAGLSVSGRREADIETGLVGVLSNPGNFFNRRVQTDQQMRSGLFLSDLSRRTGMTGSELRDLAASLGITLNESAQSFRDFLQALRDSGELYASDFAGVTQELQDTLQAEGITEPLAVLTRRLALLTDRTRGFPALADALAGIDTGTVEGRAAALSRAQALFADLQAGRIGEGGLGNLSRGEARQALLELIGGLRETTQGGPAGTGGFNESRTITEVTGSRLAGLLGTANAFLAEIAANTAGLRFGALPTFAPPSVGALGGGRASGITLVLERGAVNVTIPFGGSDPAGAMAFGDQLAPQLSDAIVRQLAAKLDAVLGQEAARRRLVTGDPRLLS